MKNYLSQILNIVWKDIILETRTKDISVPIFVFAFLTILIFNFAFEPGTAEVTAVAPGVLWVAITFAGILGFNRTFVVEKEKGCIEGLMLCPVEREIIYFGKMLTSLIFMLISELIILPIFSILFNLPIFIPELAVLAFFTSIGLAVVGTIFAALAVNTRARDIMLPIIFLPVVVPLLICAVNGSQLALTDGSWADIFPWLHYILAFDLIFLVASALVFPSLLEN